MDIVVTGRHTQVSDRFRDHLEEKLAKVAQLVPSTSRVDVVVTHEPSVVDCHSVEITARARGSVIRAEACTPDPYGSLDLALDKLMERLRRAADRQRVSRAGRRVPESVSAATGRSSLAGGLVSVPSSNGSGTTAGEDEPTGPFGAFGDSPITVREKVHASPPMSLQDALDRMELVGHDFYLFHDSESDRPSVVYRRKGWSYGVIHLDSRPDGG